MKRDCEEVSIWASKVNRIHHVVLSFIKSGGEGEGGD